MILKIESLSRFSFIFEHDLFGKPASTFPDHARDDSKSNGGARVRPRHRVICTRDWLKPPQRAEVMVPRAVSTTQWPSWRLIISTRPIPGRTLPVLTAKNPP